MTYIEIAYQVLRAAGAPLTQTEIRDRAVSMGLLQWTPGRPPLTPEATIGAQIYVDIERKGVSSRFTKVRPGVFGLSEWGGGTRPPPATPPPPPPPVGIAERLLARLRNLPASQFEHLVGRFMEAMGLRDVRVTGHSYDGGIDGEGVAPFLNVKVGFQAKNWQNNVQGDRVRALIGSMQTRGYDRGVLITTSGFTAGALEDAQGAQGRVVLIDGQTLVTKMIEKRLGIRDVVCTAEIDEVFFQQLGP